EAGHAAGSGGVQGAALAEALDEHLLNGIVQLGPQLRTAPADAEVGANDAEVPTGQFLAVGSAPGRSGADDGPAGRFGNRHGLPCARSDKGQVPHPLRRRTTPDSVLILLAIGGRTTVGSDLAPPSAGEWPISRIIGEL